MNLFFSPHNDDEAIFGSFLVQAHEALVVVVFDGHVQRNRGEAVTAAARRSETNAALKEMGRPPALFMGYSDAEPVPHTFGDGIRHLIAKHRPKMVMAPAVEVNGHEQHNTVGRVVHAVFPDTLHYLTYTRSGGRSKAGKEVVPEPDWIVRKLRALACYETQITVQNCRDHFLDGIREYVV